MNLRRNGFDLRLSGCASKARDRMEMETSERAFMEFLDVKGIVDKVCANNESHVTMERGF